MTVSELLSWATAQVKAIAPESAAREASLLLAHLLGGPIHQLTVRRDEAVAPAEEERFRRLIEKRLQRCPVQYLTGECEFYSLKFQVGEGVLIPRPETETLVQTAIEVLAESKGTPRHVVDIGTGSGCIAVAVAKNAPKGLVHVTATDISDKAIELATANVRRHAVGDAVRIVREDMRFLRTRPSVSPGPTEMRWHWKFHALLSNPPYVADAELPRLQPEVRDWEPREALLGGVEGLDCIRRLIEAGPAVVEKGGHLILEIGAGQAMKLRLLPWESMGYTSLRFVKDLSGIERVLHARLA